MTQNYYSFSIFTHVIPILTVGQTTLISKVYVSQICIHFIFQHKYVVRLFIITTITFPSTTDGHRNKQMTTLMNYDNFMLVQSIIYILYWRDIISCKSFINLNLDIEPNLDLKTKTKPRGRDMVRACALKTRNEMVLTNFCQRLCPFKTFQPKDQHGCCINLVMIGSYLDQTHAPIKLITTKTNPNQTKQELNKAQHITNGNIKLLHLNKGNSNILTKLTLIQDLVNCEKPSVISLNESNVELSQTKQTEPIKDNKFEHKQINFNNHICSKARTSVGIHNKLAYERMYNLETGVNSIIWIKLILKKQKPILIMSGYRQFKLFDEFGIKNSTNLRNQKLRLESYINSYRKAAVLGLNIVVLDDSNIDTNPKVDYSLNYKHRTLNKGKIHTNETAEAPDKG